MSPCHTNNPKCQIFALLIQRANKWNCEVWRKRVFFWSIYITGTVCSLLKIILYESKFVQEAASLLVYALLRLLSKQNCVSLVLFEHFIYIFFLQSKLSKLSQAPKLEPLNEGGGAALLQVVSLEIIFLSTKGLGGLPVQHFHFLFTSLLDIKFNLLSEFSICICMPY